MFDTSKFEIDIEGFDILNTFTPNGDNMNDFFKIKGIESFPENSIKIFNRWGVLVFESDDYGNTSSSDNVFKGFSKGRITIQKNKRLPTGTYYYICLLYTSDAADE